MTRVLGLSTKTRLQKQEPAEMMEHYDHETHVSFLISRPNNFSSLWYADLSICTVDTSKSRLESIMPGRRQDVLRLWDMQEDIQCLLSNSLSYHKMPKEDWEDDYTQASCYKIYRQIRHEARAPPTYKHQHNRIWSVRLCATIYVLVSLKLIFTGPWPEEKARFIARTKSPAWLSNVCVPSALSLQDFPERVITHACRS